MNNELNQVAEFHRAFGAFMQDSPSVGIDNKLFKLRMKLLMEEFNELQEAYENQDLVEVADALGDIAYVLLGTVVAFGLKGQFTKVFNEIHCSNMSKLGIDGNPIFRDDGKVLKGPNYFRPNISKMLNGEKHEFASFRDAVPTAT